MNCPHCGQLVSENAKACGYCGHWLTTPPATPPAGALARRIPRWGLIAGGILVLLLIAGGVIIGLLMNRPPSPPDAVADQSGGGQLRLAADLPTAAPTATPTPTATTTPEPVSDSSDRIAFVYQEQGSDGRFYSNIYTMKPDGSNRLRLTDSDAHPHTSLPAWSPDGSRIAFVSTSLNGETIAIYVVDAGGGEPVRVTELFSYSDNKDILQPVWLPDGRQIAFAARNLAKTEIGIYTVPADGSNLSPQPLKPVNDLPGVNIFPAWSPDGNHIAFINGSSTQNPDLVVMPVNSDKLEFATPLENEGGVALYPVWSPDSSRIAVLWAADPSSNASVIAVVDPGSESVAKLTTGETVNVRPAWSPDGSRIAVEARISFDADGNGTPYIYVLNSDGSDPTRLAIGTMLAADWSRVSTPAIWSPDSSRLVYYNKPEGESHQQIFIVEVDSGEITQLTTGEGESFMPTWSPK